MSYLLSQSLKNAVLF
uniref:Uncharacterized protein n=1 Tax=Anguilla anguilla TaxID=7936 RepID=A0A0E9T2B2_ANGAN